jgi:hypothetical protein
MARDACSLDHLLGFKTYRQLLEGTERRLE